MANRYVGGEKALEQFAGLMIQKIENVSDNWKQPWFSNSQSKGLPQNISGRIYNGLNSLMLYIQCEQNRYSIPVFMTFNQAKEQGVHVKKGEKSFPVLYWGFSIKGTEPETQNKKITYEEYKRLSPEEKQKYRIIPFLQNYNVFNIEQTTYPEQKPEAWLSLKEKFTANHARDDKGMRVCEELDHVVKSQTWVCPIYLKEGNSAFHIRGKDDYIVVPLKAQFHNGESFYSTLIHEMAHSTGEEHRLNREKGGAFGGAKYAKEELIAEMCAAVCCRSLAITSGIREENAQYLKNWLAALREEPRFILSVLSDVSRASNMINEIVLNQPMEQFMEAGEKHVEQTEAKDLLRVSGETNIEHTNHIFNRELEL
ncbi:MAG: ssDNA-binding domain-containing protein [Dysgonamonadaceae bacterium]|jgi:antirestriction protein ArdC|nr:ssDNA-binding domain-containing protein [Dysgonamonadaceae bacterium]